MDREGNCAVLGWVVLEKELGSITETTNDLASEGIYITGWNTLDPTVNRLIHRDMTHVLLPVSLALIAMLSLIFRDWRDITLSLSAPLTRDHANGSLVEWQNHAYTNYFATNLASAADDDVHTMPCIAIRPPPPTASGAF